MSAAVRWFLGRAVDGRLDLSNTLVVTPGARAGRVLVTLLASACQEHRVVLRPPTTSTAGAVALALVPCDRPASDLHRRLAWHGVIEAADTDILERALPGTRVGGPCADEVASAADECARGGLRFSDVALADLPPMEPPERWHALAELQSRYEALLADAGLIDPLLHALDTPLGMSPNPTGVVLLCCTDLDPLTRRLIERHEGPVDVLVAHDAGLHADGVVDDAYWDRADIEIDPSEVFVTGGPEEQGRLAVRAAMDLSTSAIGTADESLAGAVRRAGASHGLSVHVAWGPSGATTGPGRMLSDLAHLLGERSFTALDRVLRSEGFLRLLATREPRAMHLPMHLDRYLDSALPTRAMGPLPRGDARADRSRRAVLRARRRLRGWLEPLRQKPMPLSQWAGALERTLVGLFEPVEDTLGGASFATLEAAGRVLRALADLPQALDPRPVTAADALSLVVREIDVRGAPAEPGGEALDVLGWLELPLDPSPALVLMGAHDRTLPAASAPGPLLPEGLRRALGLPGAGRRLARDAAAMACLVGTRRVRFVQGQIDAVGDPLLPSTLLLRGPGDGPARVLSREAFATEHASTPPPACGYRVRVVRPAPAPLTLAVTSFRTYLRSPYEFYLRTVLGLREVEPAPPVALMQAGRYGTLLHEALRRFAHDPDTRGVTSEDQLRRWLHACLREATDELAGEQPSATMLAQIDTAERRLADFARVEAQRRRDGWRTVAVEWKPETPCELMDTGVRLTGRIDRIDWHPGEGRLALLDYKTAEHASEPNRAHRDREGRWKDLQLPLYEILARAIAAERAIEHVPTLGYINLSGQGVSVAATGWDEAVLIDAHEKAAEIARAVAAGTGSLGKLGKPGPGDAFTRLAGLGMVLDAEHLEPAIGARP